MPLLRQNGEMPHPRTGGWQGQGDRYGANPWAGRAAMAVTVGCFFFSERSPQSSKIGPIERGNGGNAWLLWYHHFRKDNIFSFQ